MATVVLLGALWFSLLQIYNSVIQPFLFGRLIAFLLALPVLFAVYWLTARPKVGETIKLWWHNPILWSWAAWLAIGWLVSAFGFNFYNSIWSTVERAGGLILWSAAAGFLIFLLASIRSHNGWKNLLASVSVIAWILAGYSLLQVIVPEFVFVGGRGAISSLFGNQVYSGMFVSLTVPLLIYHAVTVRSWFWRIFWTSGVVLQILAVYWANTAGGGVGLMAAISAFGLLWLGMRNGWSAKRITGIALGLIALAAVIVVLPLWNGSSLIEVYLRQVSSISRLAFYQGAWEAIKAHPFGYGWENARLAIQEFYNIPHDIVGFNETNTDRIHNVFLQTGVNGGWPAIISYLAIVASSAYLGLRHIWRSEMDWNDRVLALAVLSGLFGYFIALQAAFNIVSTIIVATMMTGYLIYITSRSSSVTPPVVRLQNIPMLIGLLVFGWMAIHNILPSLAAAKYADQALELSNTGQFEKAYETINKIKEYHGKTPYYYGLIRKHSSITKDYVLSLETSNPQYETALLDGLMVLDQLEGNDNKDYILLDRPILYSSLVAIDKEKYLPLLYESFAEIRSWNDKNPYVELFWARALMGAGLFTEAEAEFNRLLGTSSPPRGAYLWKASLELFQGKPADTVIKSVETAQNRKEFVVANTGDMPFQIVHELNKILTANQRWDLVVGLQENLVLTSRGEIAEEWINLAIAYRNINELDKAVEATRKSVKLDPKLQPAAEKFLSEFGRTLER